MSDSYGTIAQAALAATTLTALYTVPANRQLVGEVVFCNRSATPTTIRLSVAIAGEANANKQYRVYDFPLDGNQTIGFSVALGGSDVVRAYAADATVSVTLEGAERNA